MNRYEVHIDGNHEYDFATLAEAQEKADEIIQEIRSDAARDGEFSTEGQVKIMEVLACYEVRDVDGTFYDFVDVLARMGVQ